MSPLVVIVGETGSGKTALAIELARRFDGEIISADSRTIYKGMDIGTAKPTMAERAGVPHHGFDIVGPDGRFTAYDFQQLAYKMIDKISARGRLPIIVGGTGLYIDAVLYDFAFRPQASAEQRAALAALSVKQLQQAVVDQGLELPQNAQNPRHLTRLLEAGAPPQQIKTIPDHTLILGLWTPREQLRQRIERRVDTMVAAGLIDEVRALRARYGDIEALRAPGYNAFSAYIDGAIDLDEAKRQFVRSDMHLAKRQRTWFRREPSIHWLNGNNKLDQAEVLIAGLLTR